MIDGASRARSDINEAFAEYPKRSGHHTAPIAPVRWTFEPRKSGSIVTLFWDASDLEQPRNHVGTLCPDQTVVAARF